MTLTTHVARRMADARAQLFGPSRMEQHVSTLTEEMYHDRNRRIEAERERDELAAKLERYAKANDQLYKAASIACERYRAQIARLEAELSAVLEQRETAE